MSLSTFRLGMAALFAACGIYAYAQAMPPAAPSAATLDEKMRLLVERFEKGSQGELVVEVTEEEANAYIAQRGVGELPPGVSAPWVRFDQDLLRTGADVDVALVGAFLPEGLAQFLSGKVPVELEARVQGEGRQGTVVIQKVLLMGVALPESMVAELVEDAQESLSHPMLPPGLRLNEPFPLPYDIESVRTEKGRLVVRQRATPGVRAQQDR